MYCYASLYINDIRCLMILMTAALIDSLINAPVLAGDLPMAAVFDRSLFGDAHNHSVVLNFEQKLGHLYEQALEALIKASPALSCIDSHVQIFDCNKRTLGELDFVIFDHDRNRYIHLELAVKFYLACPSPSGGWRYPGPNASDNWQRKINHMCAHQLTLSQTPEARTVLRERFDIADITAQHLIYGCVFVPIICDDPPTPEFMAINKQQGRWLYTREWAAHFSDVKDVLFIPKPLWPVVVSQENSKIFPRISVQDLMARAGKHCTMFALEGKSEKMFLVPESWP